MLGPIYPTSLNLRGPWLLDCEQLRSLDSIIDKEYRRLEEYTQAWITAKVQESVERQAREYPSLYDTEERRQELRNNETKRLKQWEGRSFRHLILFLKGGAKLPVNSFADAKLHRDAADGIVQGFEVNIPRQSRGL